METLLQLARWGLLGRSLSLVQTARSLHCGVASWIHVKLPPEPKEVDRWTEKRALFGVSFLCPAPFTPLGILGDFQVHPKDLIIGPSWLRGWRGNELQRCIRKKQIVGHRMFDQDYKNLNKRIRFLYRRFNRTGKHR
ncbi:39S ribosomal protein L51, mitochondrial-like [Mauremys reevesii]|uniref:39S ribosomal protein L51, mitochondrial-like n=1 Tax=Mauremys reevesii TaxID=260615 RepID=UPI00193F9D07|nr:39S ribosomal protein L51, mitochondrial-like [Mauremys reevesii]